eukprot:COSAG04_NODE_1159_length_8037_cov_3.743890_5_plen_86_part_00
MHVVRVFQNLMKSKAEMAADLLRLLHEGRIEANPEPITDEEMNQKHASRGATPPPPPPHTHTRQPFPIWGFCPANFRDLESANYA